MNVRKLLDWRKVLIYSHRWLGIGFGLMFVAWFVSGMILMYWGMPHLTAGERLMRIAPLDLSTVTVTPGGAAKAAGIQPSRLRVAMLGDRPIYRFNSGSGFGTWTSIYADTGKALGGMDAQEAMKLMRRFLPEDAATIRYDAYLAGPEQWTLYPAMGPQRPLHRFALDDVADTYYYVSETTGDLIMKTDTGSRLAGFWGYSLHSSSIRRSGSSTLSGVLR